MERAALRIDFLQTLTLPLPLWLLGVVPTVVVVLWCRRLGRGYVRATTARPPRARRDLPGRPGSLSLLLPFGGSPSTAAAAAAAAPDLLLLRRAGRGDV